MVREHIRLAQLFRGWVEAHSTFEIMAPVDFSTVCFRFNDGQGEAVLNAFNARLIDAVNETGKIYLTHTSLRGKYVLRLVVGQRTTREHHVRAAWELILAKATEIA
jgi:aromatic-L-amino-acid decarboxylase